MHTKQSSAESKKSLWGKILGLYIDRRSFSLLILGLSAGLPFALLHGSLTAWLRQEGIARATIGYISWIGIFYGVKVLWAPVVDHVRIPLIGKILGQRRSWILLSQLAIMAGLVWMVVEAPDRRKPDSLIDLTGFVIGALWVAFWSATQDIAVDAYRIEVAGEELQGIMSANYIFGYRVALSFLVGVGAFYLAEDYSWADAYLLMTACFIVPIVVLLFSPEPPPRTIQHFHGIAGYLKNAVVKPFSEFFARQPYSHALCILLFISLCRISDIIMGPMANPLYKDLGFANDEIANITKLYGFWVSILGGFIAGLLVARYSVQRLLPIAVLFLAVPNAMFMILADSGKDFLVFTLTISADNFGNAVAATVFVAYFSSLANQAYTATQYALFSSLMNLPGNILGGFSGWVVEKVGYGNFFLSTAVFCIPALILAFIIPQFLKKQKTKTLSYQ